MNTQKNHDIRQRVTVFLNRQQVDFLDKLGKDALFSRGSKLSRIKIISCLVNLLMELDVNTQGISSIEELKQKIKQKIGISLPLTREMLTFDKKQGK